MKTKPLGRTGIMVSELCLGSMTWGTQNDAEEAHAQIDRALAAGINFIDTAEMYPVNPTRAETIGRTERIIGLWIEDRGRRGDVTTGCRCWPGTCSPCCGVPVRLTSSATTGVRRSPGGSRAGTPSRCAR